MITKDNLNVYNDLYIRANGVLSFDDQTSIIVDGKTTTPVAAASVQGYEPIVVPEEGTPFSPGQIDNIHAYFAYLNILAAYEQAQMDLVSRKNEGENVQIQPVQIHRLVKKIGENGIVVSEYEKSEEEFQPIYTMLPFDEPRFNINLNTRRIEIPSGFVSQQVKNDNFAETIWFEVDRYFDAVDLSGTDITIQWDTGKDQNVTQALNVTANLYAANLYGKIVFGWPLTNDITSGTNNVRFSIRFHKEVDGQVIYNLTTLPINLKINDTLTIDGIVDPLETSGGFYNNLRYKSYYTTATAGEPELVVIFAEKENHSQAQLTNGSIDLIDGKLTLVARGQVKEGGRQTNDLGYTWFKYEVDGDNIVAKVYDKDADSIIVHDNDKKEYSHFVATEPGAYGVIISNYYGGDTAIYQPTYLQDGKVHPHLIQIPYPKAPEFKPIAEKQISVDTNKTIAFVLENNNGNTPSYQWLHSSSENGEYSPVEKGTSEKLSFAPGKVKEGWYKLSVTNARNGAEKEGTSKDAFIVTEAPKPRSVVSFQGDGMGTVKVDESANVVMIETKAANTKITPNISSNLNGLKDKASLHGVEVKWYVGEGVSADKLATNVEGNSLIIKDESEDGRYTCEVITSYNRATVSHSTSVLVWCSF